MNKFIVSSIIFIWPFLVFAQDSTTQVIQDHGPRAGKVIGSGPVLAEVVWWGSDSLQLYFLSSQWVDIQENGAIVKASLKTSKQPTSVPVPCTEGKYFNYSCVLPEAKSIKAEDTLTITRTFKAEPPKTFEYRFPSDAKP